jgi:hypothetical protein
VSFTLGDIVGGAVVRMRGDKSLVEAPKPARHCDKKVRHESPAAAEAHRQGLIRERLTDPERLSVYVCRYCGCWHVGNRDPLRWEPLAVSVADPMESR